MRGNQTDRQRGNIREGESERKDINRCRERMRGLGSVTYRES